MGESTEEPVLAATSVRSAGFSVWEIATFCPRSFQGSQVPLYRC